MFQPLDFVHFFLFRSSASSGQRCLNIFSASSGSERKRKWKPFKSCVWTFASWACFQLTLLNMIRHLCDAFLSRKVVVQPYNCPKSSKYQNTPHCHNKLLRLDRDWQFQISRSISCCFYLRNEKSGHPRGAFLRFQPCNLGISRTRE